MSELVPVQQRMRNMAATLNAKRGYIQALLPNRESAERLVAVTLTSIARTPRLLECTQESVLGAIYQVVQLGLEPDNVLGQAYLIPYGNKCQLIIGYKGLIALARRSGFVDAIYARCVHAKDEFSFRDGSEQEIHHVPSMDADVGELRCVYAVVRMRGGGTQVEVMSVHEVEAIRKRASKGKKGSPWDTDYEEMAKKTVLRRLCKVLALTPQVQRAVALDDMADAGQDQNLEADVDAIEASVSPVSTEVLEPTEPRRDRVDG